jgi:predicted DNA-binding transcriptional regulator AlpA
LEPKGPLSDYFTREELAQALGRTVKTLDRWNLNGLGPPRVQIGKLVLYRKAAVEKWLLDREGKRHEPAGVNR